MRTTGHFYLNERYLHHWWKRTELDADGCWIWKGPVSKAGGYGQVTFRGQPMTLHRASYILFFDCPIAAGMEIHHLCLKPRCWRPDHLHLCTAEEHHGKNGYHYTLNQRRTHCPNGHEFTEANRLARYEDPRRFRCKACAYKASANWEKGNSPKATERRKRKPDPERTRQYNRAAYQRRKAQQIASQGSPNPDSSRSQ